MRKFLFLLLVIVAIGGHCEEPKGVAREVYSNRKLITLLGGRCSVSEGDYDLQTLLSEMLSPSRINFTFRGSGDTPGTNVAPGEIVGPKFPGNSRRRVALTIGAKVSTLSILEELARLTNLKVSLAVGDTFFLLIEASKEDSATIVKVRRNLR